MPQLRNIINLILMGKTKDGLSTVQDRLELREEIKASGEPHPFGRQDHRSLLQRVHRELILIRS